MKQAFEGDTKLKELIAQVIKRHGINIVIETGTETGATAEAFAAMVDNVYTVDCHNLVDRELPSNVVHTLGDSVEFLDNLLPEMFTDNLDLRALFYLDAHLAPIYTRVLEELEILATQSFPDVVIAIHDFLVPGHPELGFDTYFNLGPLCVDLVAPFMNRIFPTGWVVSHNFEAEGAKRGVGIFCAR